MHSLQLVRKDEYQKGWSYGVGVDFFDGTVQRAGPPALALLTVHLPDLQVCVSVRHLTGQPLLL